MVNVRHGTILQLTNVTKRFGAFTAVDRFSLTVEPGQVLGFLGPNGAGKTTTIRMIMSILFPDDGEIRVLGHPRASEVKDRIGYLPEERGLYRKMTVEATLRYFGRLKGLGGDELSRRIDEGLSRVSLAAWRRKPVDTLSKGMQQKLQFVATLLHRPELVILDEPFSGLDPINTELLTRLMTELRQSGATVVFSTHQMEQAQRLCDRIVLINRGRKLIEGSPGDVRARFAAPVLVIDGEGDLNALRTLPGVRSAHVTSGHARIELDSAASPDVILRAAVDRIRLTRYEIQSPDLQEVFVRLVEQDAGSDRTALPAR
jgi:ABC-2 type transport system ATP-binding protein